MTIAPTVGAALEARPLALAGIPRSAWDRLAQANPAATPFARWAFHRAWWDAYGDTAHEQYLVCVRGGSPPQIEADDIRAIAPLMHRHEVEPQDIATKTILREHHGDGTSVSDEAKAIFFGASYHADYATLLAEPADLASAAQAVARALAGPPDAHHGKQPWDVVDLRRLRADDPALTALETALAAQDPTWRVASEAEDVCPVVTAPSDDWDEYLATLDKKARHEIRRKLRRAARVGQLSVEIARPTPEVVDQFIELHRARFGEHGLFPDNEGGERSRRFVHRLAELELADPDGGQMHFGLVRCGGWLVYAVLAFDDGQTCFLYNAGIDPAAAEASPGVTGTAEYFRERMAAGRRRFDFLRGDEPYKYEWGARDEPIRRLLAQRG
ncbi:GNAT family N-acetyltransferase [soil metagenome]